MNKSRYIRGFGRAAGNFLHWVAGLFEPEDQFLTRLLTEYRAAVARFGGSSPFSRNIRQRVWRKLLDQYGIEWLTRHKESIQNQLDSIYQESRLRRSALPQTTLVPTSSPQTGASSRGNSNV